MEKRYVGILSITSKNFHEEVEPFILEEMDNPNVHFLISDENVLAHRLLSKRKFQNYTIYHIGETSKLNHRYLKGGYSSYIEIRESIKETSSFLL